MPYFDIYAHLHFITKIVFYNRSYSLSVSFLVETRADISGAFVVVDVVSIEK